MHLADSNWETFLAAGYGRPRFWVAGKFNLRSPRRIQTITVRPRPGRAARTVTITWWNAPDRYGGEAEGAVLIEVTREMGLFVGGYPPSHHQDNRTIDAMKEPLRRILRAELATTHGIAPEG